ncbi:hypothetical protein D4S03_10930 [bacterium]|nr:MAG: hypothetical protein D4S03_10930 [bacterium]
MPNDDLGSFPLPPLASPTPTPSADPQIQAEPIIPEVPISTTPVTPPIIPNSVFSPEPPAPNEALGEVGQTPPFEETPEAVPSIQAPPKIIPQPQPDPQPQEVPATLPPKSANPIVPIIIVVLLIVAGIGLATAAFLSVQTNKLKAQLTEITQTFEKQQTTLTPTVTPTIFEIPTPTIATQSSNVTPSATPTIAQTLNSLLPLKNASSALQIAIDHSPNAQLILIKVDNATNAETAVTKYFFREDLSTKKYFYVAITGKGIPDIIDKQIYVTPDDNIPSLNDSVLSDKLGLDLDEAVRMTYTRCANQTVCTNAPIKAQYIKTGSGIIWQLSLYTNGLSATPLMIQINAETKAILYQSPEFANK